MMGSLAAAEVCQDTSARCWSPMAFGSPDGSVVECWACTLPARFGERLADDLDGLRRVAADRALSGNGTLIEADRAMVDGRAAFRRVVRLGTDGFPVAVYVADCVVPFADGIGLQITVTCGALGGLPPGQRLMRSGDATGSTTAKVTRSRKIGGQGAPTPRLGLTEARERARHTLASLGLTIGRHKQTVWAWEAGLKKPRMDIRPRLAAALRISDDELDRLIQGEPFRPAGATGANGPGGATWLIDVDRLPRRRYPEVPIPATALMLSACAGEVGLWRAQQILDEIMPAVRITPGAPA